MSLCQCLFHVCCDDSDSDSGDEYEDSRSPLHPDTMIRGDATTSASSPPVPLTRMNRSSVSSGGGSYQATSSTLDTEEGESAAAAAGVASLPPAQARSGDDNDADCHARAVKAHHASGLNEFFRHLQERWQGRGKAYDSLEQQEEAASSSSHRKKKARVVPVKAASSFCDASSTCSDHHPDHADEQFFIPTIRSQEIVMPGSALQQQMAKAVMESSSFSPKQSSFRSANSSLHSRTKSEDGSHPDALQEGAAAAAELESEDDEEDECVICMEGFDPTNPRMPTHCGCGDNKTYFHLPCLYQWIEQCPDCPSCRQPLHWDEF